MKKLPSHRGLRDQKCFTVDTGGGNVTTNGNGNGFNLDQISDRTLLLAILVLILIKS
jgi:hypothetical protein